MPLASMTPASSSKVSTKSTSLRTCRREASSFLAAQGPMKHIRASGSAALIIRAVKTMGVMVIEMFLAMSGNRVLAIMLQAGQQEVAMKFSFSGTSFRKSWASSTVHRSAPMATSTVSQKPHLLQGGLQLGGGVQGGGTG